MKFIQKVLLAGFICSTHLLAVEAVVAAEAPAQEQPTTKDSPAKSQNKKKAQQSAYDGISFQIGLGGSTYSGNGLALAWRATDSFWIKHTFYAVVSADESYESNKDYEYDGGFELQWSLFTNTDGYRTSFRFYSVTGFSLDYEESSFGRFGYRDSYGSVASGFGGEISVPIFGTQISFFASAVLEFEIDIHTAGSYSLGPGGSLGAMINF